MRRMDCFRTFRSARFVYPAVELIKIYCSRDHRSTAVVQIASRIMDILHLDNEGTIVPYKFASSSSYEPQTHMWRRNWNVILHAVVDLPASMQPHPLLQHRQTGSQFVCVQQRLAKIPPLRELAAQTVEKNHHLFENRDALSRLVPRSAASLLVLDRQCTQCRLKHHRPYAQLLEKRALYGRINVLCLCSFNCFLEATACADLTELSHLNPKLDKGMDQRHRRA